MTDPRAEIWESFVSLLRCYAAAASVPGSEYLVLNAVGATEVKHDHRVLSFRFQPSSGDATWQLLGEGAESRGSFHMREDSTLEFTGETKELDMAAIDFIEQLAQATPELPGLDYDLSSRPKRAEGERSGGTCFSPSRRHHTTTRAQQRAGIENKLSSRPKRAEGERSGGTCFSLHSPRIPTLSKGYPSINRSTKS